MRTSQSHPLQIAQVRHDENHGRIGVTFCPGKKQTNAATGAWNRNLEIDLDAARDWGAAAVVTLVEDHELEALGVEAMGEEVRSRHMAWHHLAIPDVSVPSAQFECQWEVVGHQLRAILRSGFNVLVHCKGGLGRAGTISARLLVELGTVPEVAISSVRAARPGAIETEPQRLHVLDCTHVLELVPDTSGDAIRSRAIGALLGLAIGDAVGTTLEFRKRDSYPMLTDMIGGGPFSLKPGEWTDDTAMALALADSLERNPDLDEKDLMARFVDWHEQGTYSCTGRCFDIGTTTREALSRWRLSGNPVAGSIDPMTAGNGSLMRLAPVAIRHFRNRERLRDVAARQSRTTHAAPEAVDACVVYAEAIADAIEGQTRSEVLRSRPTPSAGAIGNILAGSWRGKSRSAIRASGYVAHSLEASLWSIGRTASYRDAVLTAANLGEDADTTAAITGQLAGALYGLSGLPDEWLGQVAWKPRIMGVAEKLIIAPKQ